MSSQVSKPAALWWTERDAFNPLTSHRSLAPHSDRGLAKSHYVLHVVNYEHFVYGVEIITQLGART